MNGEFVVAGWLVQPSLNRLSRGQAITRLEPKVMQVLVCLAERPGDVVTRETLISTVWPDVFVTDDVLHRAVRELRRVFQDDAARPTCIETIRKRGYRLIAPVSQPRSDVEEPASAMVGPPPTRTVARPRLSTFAAVAALLVLACGVAITLLVSRPLTTTQAQPRFVALTGGALNETDPAIAPDGQRVAFVRRESSDTTGQADLYVSSNAGALPERLTTTSADERFPVWSPDGSEIAFLRVAGDGCDVVVRRAQDASERIVMPCPNRDEPHMAWTGDGAGLVYSRAAGESGASGSRIAVAAAASGAERLLTSPPPGLPGDHSPVVSPDGKDIAFVRQISGGIADLYIVPLAGGLERRVTFEDADVEGLTWSDNGRALVFSSDRAGGYTLWRVPAEGGALQFVAGGALRLKNPVASARGDRIAYENWVYDINVWSTSSSGAVERVTTTSDLWNYFPQVSPDGQQVVYVSTASGEQELWLARRDGSGARQLTRFGRVARQEASRSASLRMPRWSPDGRAIVVVVHFGAGSDVFVVEAATGDLTRLTHDSNLEAAPSWSADGSAVLVGVRTRGQWDVWTLPMPNRKDGATPQIALPGAYAAQAATDDVVFFTYADRAGLWRHRTGSHQPDQIAQVSPSDWANWVVATRAVYRVVVEHGIPVVEQLDFEGNLVRRVGELSQMTWPGFSVAPDGRVLYARWERRQSRIMLLETS